MVGIDRTVWLRVANGVESLSDAGSRVWSEPSQTRKALSELLGVFPVTHVQVDLRAWFGDGTRDWPSLLTRSGAWPELLNELTLALGSAVRAPAVWGVGLPGPGEIAESLGDTSERGVLKAGLQLASFLQGFRELPLGFVAVDTGETPISGAQRALGPIFRNTQMYGWRRAVCLPDLTLINEARWGAEVMLVRDAEVEALSPLWARNEPVGGGMTDSFWRGETPGGAAPQRFLLYGTAPKGIAPRAIVEAGRVLRSWMGEAA